MSPRAARMAASGCTSGAGQSHTGERGSPGAACGAPQSLSPPLGFCLADRRMWLAMRWVLTTIFTLATGGATSAEELPEVVGPRATMDSYPAFSVRPRIPVLSTGDYYPCSDCHDGETQVANPRVRKLTEEHTDIPAKDHTKGRHWCLRCHSERNRDMLVDLDGQLMSFDESYLLCGQCHGSKQNEVFLGTHGKRLGSWQGDRLIATCVECHNPHSPKFKARTPYAPPQTRRGLQGPTRPTQEPLPVWDRIAISRGWAAQPRGNTAPDSPAGGSQKREAP